MPFTQSDVKSAFVNMRQRYDKFVLNAVNSMITKIATDPKQPVVCSLQLKSIPETSLHIVMEGVAYLLYSAGHRYSYKLTLEQTNTDTPDDVLLEAENNRVYTATIKAHILPKEYLAEQMRQRFSKAEIQSQPLITNASAETENAQAVRGGADATEEHSTPNGEGGVSSEPAPTDR